MLLKTKELVRVPINYVVSLVRLPVTINVMLEQCCLYMNVEVFPKADFDSEM